MVDFLSRARGALVGLAVGDALGTTHEFQPAGSFEPITGMVGGGGFGLEPGQWTDDTSMALCLADSLLAQGRYDSFDVMERYERWYSEGYRSSTGVCFDIGNQVSRALWDFRANPRVPVDAVRTTSAGNGAIMRLAPVVIAGFERAGAPARRIVRPRPRPPPRASPPSSWAHYWAGRLSGSWTSRGPQRERRSTAWPRV